MVKRYVLLLMMKREEEGEARGGSLWEIFRGAGARLE